MMVVMVMVMRRKRKRKTQPEVVITSPQYYISARARNPPTHPPTYILQAIDKLYYGYLLSTYVLTSWPRYIPTTPTALD
jgi:hypothetical protein